MRIISPIRFILFLSFCLTQSVYAGRIETNIEIDLHDQTGAPVQDWMNVTLSGTRSSWGTNPYPPFFPSHDTVGYTAVSGYVKANSRGHISLDFVGDYDGTPSLSVDFGSYFSCTNRRTGEKLSAAERSEFHMASGESCRVDFDSSEALAEITGGRTLRMTCTLTTTRETYERNRARFRESIARDYSLFPAGSCHLLQ